MVRVMLKHLHFSVSMIGPQQCRICGASFPTGATFCPSCGAARYPSAVQTSLNPGFLIGGILLPPLWTHEVWKQSWPGELKLALAALFAIGPAFVDLGLFGIGLTATFGVIVLNVIVTILVVSSVSSGQPSTVKVDEVRRSIEQKFHACHDLIVRLEREHDIDSLPRSFRGDYVRLLEVRAEAAELFEQATSPAQLATADSRVTEAVQGLQQTEIALETKPQAD